MMIKYLPRFGLLALSLGCGTADRPGDLVAGDTQLERTGLEGVVRRGPIQPVCRVSEPCTAPFSARFEVRQGERVLSRFQSDSAGRFLTYLPPGTYTLAPDPSAPLLGAAGQTRDITVGSRGLTHVDLDFDTGIR